MKLNQSKIDPSISKVSNYPILTTKLFIPFLQSNLVSRNRLIDRLSQGSKHKLTLISAPAGFGKTTLLSEWIHQSQAPSAWFSIDKGDNDPIHFLNYVIAALQTIDENIGSGIRSLLKSPRLPNMQSMLINLINDLAQFGDNFLLVFDDYHLIEDQKIHDLIGFMLEHLPPKMHLVMATRSDPPLPLARLRSQNQVLELRAADLCFTLDETAILFNERLCLGLSQDNLAMLESRTEGWIAGLQLAALSIQNRNDVQSFIQHFSSDNRYIMDYLFEEVLSQKSQDVQQFLLHTSILDRLSGSLCDAVTQGQNSQQMLRVLDRENLFIFPLDSERKWLRYHQLFVDLLRQRLRQMHGALVPELYYLASQWFEQNKFIDEAVEYALMGEDFDRAISLIQRHAETKLMQSEIVTIQKWIERLPETEVRTRPQLCIYHSVTLLYSGHPFSEAESRIRDALAADASESISAEVTAFRGLVAAFQGKNQESIQLSRQALEQLPEDRLFFRSFITGFLGLNYLYSGEIEAARQTFTKAVTLGQKIGNLMISVLAQCHLAELCFLEAKLKQAKTNYEQTLEWANDDQGMIQPIGGYVLIGLGNLYREWNDFDTAEHYFNRGIELVKKWGEIAAMHGYIGLAKINQIRGDFQTSQKLFQEARGIAERFDAMDLDDLTVAYYQARSWIAHGDIEQAEQWAISRNLDPKSDIDNIIKKIDQSLTLLPEFEITTLARLYIARKEPEDALTILQALEPILEQKGWIAFTIENLMLQAIALHELDEDNQAISLFRRSLSLAEAGGFIRLFVDEGEPVKAMLVNLLHERAALKEIDPQYSVSKSYLNKLFAAFETDSQVRRKSGLLESLTDREIEVLHLIAAGLSNQEIANKLFISLNTVRTHTKNINNKLNTHSRTQAVAKARELGVI